MTPSTPDSVSKMLDAYLPSVDTVESIDLQTEEPLIIFGFETGDGLNHKTKSRNGVLVAPLHTYNTFLYTKSQSPRLLERDSTPRTLLAQSTYNKASSTTEGVPELIVHSDSNSDSEAEDENENDSNNSSISIDDLSSPVITESNKYNKRMNPKSANSGSILPKRIRMGGQRRIPITKPKVINNSKNLPTISSLYKTSSNPTDSWTNKILHSIVVDLSTPHEVSNFKFSDSWSLFKVIKEIEQNNMSQQPNMAMICQINKVLLKAFYNDTSETFKFTMPQFIHFISFTSNLFEITDPKGNTIILKCSGSSNDMTCRAKLSLYYDFHTRSVYLTRIASWTHTHCHSPIWVGI